MPGRVLAPQADLEEAQETTPVVTSSKTANMWRVVLFGTLMISFSVCLINFNKFLMTGSFPFPVHLVLIHTISGTVFASVLYRCVPSLFPSLSDPLTGVRVNRELIMGKALPIAIAFAGTLVLSNMAYKHASVAFLQFMKEGNVILVYCLSLLVGLECFKCQALSILSFIMIATTLCIHGELHFSLVAFVIQGSSQLFEVTRIVLQTMLLAASGTKLDAMTYVLIVMPLCFMVLLISLFFIFGLQAAGVSIPMEIQSPQWQDYVAAAPLLCCNATVAFALNVTIALFIKNTSAVAMVLAGIVKDCCVVLISLVLFHESISNAQAMGFCLQLLGVLAWSLMTRFPVVFETHGVLGGLLTVLLGKESKVEKCEK